MSEPSNRSVSHGGSRSQLTAQQTVFYGTGTLVLNLLPAALGIFAFFLVTAFGMDPVLAGLLTGLPRLFDALTDPIMGFITDNTRSQWGRRRPYIVIGAILSGVLFALLWQLDAENSQRFNFWYFLLLSLAFTIGNTMFATPFVGLGYEITSDYNARTRLMAVSQFMGQIAWMIVPWFWVLIANPEVFPTQEEGVRELSLYVAGICIVLGIVPGLFCKGIDGDKIENQAEISFRTIAENVKGVFRSISETFSNSRFVKLCAATFLVFNGFQLVSQFAYFIIVFHMFDGDYGSTGTWPAWFGTVSALMTAFLVIPIVTWLAKKVGKRKAFIISTLISMLGYALKWYGFNPEHPWMIFLPIPLMSFGIGGLFTLMLSMTADVCDLDELKNGMPRKEGTFAAIYWLMVKIGQALAMFLGGLVLSFVGFDPSLATQSVETMTKLRIADIIIPILTAGLAVVVMWKYDLDEDKADEIKQALIQLRGDI
uniref:MFS transporter n=1 Tax=Ningiella ruwaisensis TaxID=2364274 RepID=UPI00109F377F|nr:MFS transporter [Ningiella ruwaisensis]